MKYFEKSQFEKTCSMKNWTTWNTQSHSRFWSSFPTWYELCANENSDYNYLIHIIELNQRYEIL